MKMYVGKKLVLCDKVPFYKSFQEYSTKFIEIEITEKKLNVPGEFSGATTKTGYLAKGSDGFTYAYNYPYANEGFGDTVWRRYMPDDEFNALSEPDIKRIVSTYFWFDATKCFRGVIPNFLKKYSYLKACPEHKLWYYEGDT